MKIFITSGGTKIPLDPVRDITNMSKGTFGAKIATEALNLGHEVFFFTAENGITPFSVNINILDKEEENAISEIKEKFIWAKSAGNIYSEFYFRNYADYARNLPLFLDSYQPDIIILAAAVSDYTTDQKQDKIKSNEDLTISLIPTEKVISKVKQWCPDAILVGFKLLVNSTEEELINAAIKSIKDNDCDLVIGNDLTSLKRGKHEILLVESNGETSWEYTNPALAVITKSCLLASKNQDPQPFHPRFVRESSRKITE